MFRSSVRARHLFRRSSAVPFGTLQRTPLQRQLVNYAKSATERTSRKALWATVRPSSIRRNDAHRFSSTSNPGKEGGYSALAIETSCDDTSVALVEVCNASSDLQNGTDANDVPRLNVLFHEKVTANNDEYTGIHPIVALDSHRANLAPLVQRAMRRLSRYASGDAPSSENSLPLKFVAVTRGPGMRSNLAVGLDTAKGIAVALDKPLMGVHHMQAHALTPRLLTAMANKSQDAKPLEPAFPFLTVLVSGGHTMLLNSTSLTEHRTLAEAQDIAIGDFLDKAARAILPPERLRPPFGKALEEFAFCSQIRKVDETMTENLDIEKGSEYPLSEEVIQPSEPDYSDYSPPSRRQDELESRSTRWGWALTPPLAESKGGEKSSRRMVYSFAGLLTSIERLVKRPDPLFSLRERQDLAREVERVAFQHLTSRILLYLESSSTFTGDTVVVSGGVASNSFLRHVLRSTLDARGYQHIKLCFPPIELCTDNALMIAWAAIEMHRAGYTSSLEIGPIRKWSMDSNAADGGILGPAGWIKNNGDDEKN
ncbi:peptidase M22, glycoprotease [Hortaea werneckii]|nr:peptidase M22, glycoprotease [Hortaea werneckii]